MFQGKREGDREFHKSKLKILQSIQSDTDTNVLDSSFQHQKKGDFPLLLTPHYLSYLWVCFHKTLKATVILLICIVYSTFELKVIYTYSAGYKRNTIKCWPDYLPKVHKIWLVIIYSIFFIYIIKSLSFFLTRDST